MVGTRHFRPDLRIALAAWNCRDFFPPVNKTFLFAARQHVAVAATGSGASQCQEVILGSPEAAALEESNLEQIISQWSGCWVANYVM